MKIKWKLCNPHFSEHKHQIFVNAGKRSVRNLGRSKTFYNKTFLSGSVLSDIVEIQFVFISAWDGTAYKYVKKENLVWMLNFPYS